jgi:hypothetical protein
MTSSFKALSEKKLSTISCSLIGIENLKTSMMLSISLALTSLPSLVTGFHSTYSFFLSPGPLGFLSPGFLSPPLSAPLPNPLFCYPSGFGTCGCWSAIKN